MASSTRKSWKTSYIVHSVFCTERDPDMPEPPREQCEPFVKKIIMELKPTLDENDDGVISREEFELFGQYLTGEYEKLQNEMLEANQEPPAKPSAMAAPAAN